MVYGSCMCGVGGDLLDSHLLLHSDGDNDTIALSVYFHQATMVKYRTDVVLDWLDLIGWCETFSLCFLFVYVCVCVFSVSLSVPLLCCSFYPPLLCESKRAPNQLCKLALKYERRTTNECCVQGISKFDKRQPEQRVIRWQTE